MKLYTEEQVRKAIDRGYSSAMCEDSTITKTADDFLQSLTPIELPSDEEIKHKINKEVFVSWFSNDEYERGFQDGAKWSIEHIKKEVI